MALPSQFPNNNLLRFNARCPVCSNAYDLQKLKILGEREQQLLAYIDCPVCGTALLTILSVGQNGMTAQGVVTDLTVEEVVESEEWDPVGDNNVLELHQALESAEAKMFSLKR